MVTIQDIEILKSHELNVIKRKTKKTQILLYDTQRRADDFINKIKYRLNGKYPDVPHYLITKSGNIFQLFNPNHSSVTFNDPQIDKKQIKIALENLGWLNKNTINGFLFNWVNDPYRAQPMIKGWRNRYYWDVYTPEQMESVYDLCNHLCKEYSIKKQIVTSQGFYENARNLAGIVCKSNFSDIYTDINPSFNFRLFLNEEEQINQLRPNKKNA